MAWEARLGLKLREIAAMCGNIDGLNGLGSPSGIETHTEREIAAGDGTG